MDTQPPPSQPSVALAWHDGALSPRPRSLPEETPVALTYDRATFAVMMATPQDLEDFAIGFSVTEGIVTSLSEIEDLEIRPAEAGIECRITLNAARGDAWQARRRHVLGAAGCGLCGMESLEQAALPARRVTSPLRLPAAAIAEGFAGMQRLQSLNRETHAVHAAAFLHPNGELLLREDVGRHNALDKLIGAALRRNLPPAEAALLLTSRVSIELIQKAAIFGAPILAAISVPTARAVREAERAGITLIGIARGDGFEIFTHPDRIIAESPRI